MAKKFTHAMIQNVDGVYRVKTLQSVPPNAGDLLSQVEAINFKNQLTVWFSKELPLETAQSLAKKFADDMRKDLSDS